MYDLMTELQLVVLGFG